MKQVFATLRERKINEVLQMIIGNKYLAKKHYSTS